MTAKKQCVKLKRPGEVEENWFGAKSAFQLIFSCDSRFSILLIDVILGAVYQHNAVKLGQAHIDVSGRKPMKYFWNVTNVMKLTIKEGFMINN